MSSVATQEPTSATSMKPFPNGPLIPPAQSVGPEFFRPDMPLEQLQRSPLNPRKHFDQVALAELARSIKELGIIEPLVARPVGGHYEIVAGERRYRASQLAELTAVPVIVKSLSDAQALEVMVVENNQREDVTALEEAEGFRQLLATGYDADRLAERIGRSKKFVYDRLKLFDLVPAAQQLLVDNRITAGHAILLARLKPADQARALNPEGGLFEFSEHDDDNPTKDEPYRGSRVLSVREFNAWIEDNVRLDLAKRVSAEEFPDVARAQEAAERVVSITHEYYLDADVKKGAAAGDTVLLPREWKRADGTKGHDPSAGRDVVFKTCDASMLGVVVIGRDRGAAFKVCTDLKCDVHWKKEAVQRRQDQALRDSGQSAKADQAEKDRRAKEQRAYAEAEAKRKTWLKLEPLVIADAVEQVREVKNLTASQAAVIGDIDCYDVGGKLEKLLGKSWFKSPAAAWLALACAASSNESSFDGFVNNVAKPLGLNVKRLEVIRDKFAPASGAPKVQPSALKAKSPTRKKKR